MIVATAPGKLMIGGEYAVAGHGGAALAAAVGRRVTVELTLGGVGWRVTSPDLGLVEGPPAEVPVVDRLLKEMEGLPGGGHLTITSELGVGPKKPGLGASSAVCVAVYGALWAATGAEGEPDVRVPLEAHLAAQGGLGSGYDVATVQTGGLCGFTNSGDEVGIAAMDWPSGLHAAVVFTGQGASTVEMLARVERFRTEDAEAYGWCMDRMRLASEQLTEAWSSGLGVAVLDALVDAEEALLAFSREGEIGVEDGGQAEALAVLEEAGAVGRTSGAGGGDCVWAFALHEDVIARAAKAAQAAGFEVLDVALGVEGLTVEVR